MQDQTLRYSNDIIVFLTKQSILLEWLGVSKYF